MQTAAPEVPKSLAQLYVTHRVLTMESAAVAYASDQNVGNLRRFFQDTKNFFTDSFKRWSTNVYPAVNFSCKGKFIYEDVLNQRAYVPPGLIVTMPEYVTGLHAAILKVLPKIVEQLRQNSAIVGKAVNDADLRRSVGFVTQIGATDINDELALTKAQYGKGNVSQVTVGKAYGSMEDIVSTHALLVQARHCAATVHPKDVRKEVERFVVVADALTEELVKDHAEKEISTKLISDISEAIYNTAKLVEYYGYLVNSLAEGIKAWNDTDAILKKN